MSWVSSSELASALGVGVDTILGWGDQIPRLKTPTGRYRYDLEACIACLRDSPKSSMSRPRGSGRGSVRFHRGGWEATIRIEGKRLYKRNQAWTKADALDWLARVRIQGKAPLDSRSLSVAALVEQFLQKKQGRVKPGTIAFYRSHLEGKTTWAYRYREAKAAGITPSDIEDFLDALIGKRTPGGINSELRAIRAVFRWAHKRRILEGQDPTLNLEAVPDSAPKVQRALQVHELAQLLRVANPDYLVAWMLMGIQGLRSAEVKRATWDWIDLDRAVLTVKEGKTGSHEMPLSPWLKEVLMASGRREGRLVASSTFHRPLQRDLKQAGIKGTGISPHTLRRSFLTILDRLGCSYGILKAIARHSKSTDVTLRYLIATVEDMRPWIEKLSAEVRVSSVSVAVLKRESR